MLTFQFTVQSHYEAQPSQDSDTNGLDLAVLNVLWGDSSNERIVSVVDVFPAALDVLENLETLRWEADLPLIHGIDEAVLCLG